MNRQQRYSTYAGLMLALLIGLIMLLLGGCVRATYHASQGEEDFKLWSVLKSVDGLAVAALELTKKQESWARLDCGRFITKDVLRGG